MQLYELEYDFRTESIQMDAPHSHENIYELYCLVKGNLQAVFNDRLLDVSAPALVVIPPGEKHKNNTGPIERYLIYISPDNLNDFEKKCLDNMSMQAITLPDRAIALIKEMYTLEQACAVNSKEKQLMILNYFIYLMLNQHEADHISISLKKSDKKFIVTKIINYLDHNYNKQIYYDELAKEFAISTSSLSKYFRNATGKSIGEYILQVRIKKAKELLKWTTKSVEEIATLTGFCNASYFTKRFQKESGFTPLQYRQHKRT